MILVDTSVLISYLKNQKNKSTEQKDLYLFCRAK